MKILAIETSCDETAIALVEAKGNPFLKNLSAPSASASWRMWQRRMGRIKNFKNLVASQIEIHRPFGGVVPNLAKREHLKNLPALLLKVNPPAGGQISNVGLIAVTVGPGLEPALWTGINFAKEIHKQLTTNNSASWRMTTKLIGVNHLEGHLYSFLLNPQFSILNSQSLFPAIALIVSGGHTILIKMDSLVKYKKIGETRDDAAGECFDKVARLLNLPYPGGPEIEKLAKKGNPNAINFPRPMLNQKNYDFSFSGLKTAVLYYLRDKNLKPKSYKLKANVAASFQKAAFDVLVRKTLRAALEFRAKSIMISGGVAANKTLQKEFINEIKKQKLSFKFHVPSFKFCTDNAAMIAVAGYIDYIKGKKRRLIAKGNLSL